ncbi:response regulator transcription factor [Adlercreutzia sp. ZJ242]|uniref:response regulator transcription factor n=1 Tax=Adlercreutzia sp. ZJ242 TaxID=2709409 RepID=UPI0013ED6A7E|nr:response regulator transcription factor [Adlercreutzia sp. ZJ242]
MHVLIVEDDARLAAALAHILEENGYRVDVVHDGEAGAAYAETGIYDVVVLDVMLPRKDGFAVTTELRRAHVSTPILLLTARDATTDKIFGYDSGADDYMTKPFSPAELMAHLRALTRRQGDVVFERLAAGDLTLDLESYELTCGAKSIHLSLKEFSIARILMGSPGAVISKDTLIAKTWGVESSAGDNNVEAYISFLRKKLAHLGSTAKVETIRKAGYRLVQDDAVDAKGTGDADDVVGAMSAGGASDAGDAGEAAAPDAASVQGGASC